MLVIFDLDGTLIDSVTDLSRSVAELVTTLGGRPLAQDEVAAMVGDGAAVLVKRALSAAGVHPDVPNVLEKFLAIYNRRLLETTVAYPGIEEVLRTTSRRVRMAVLTNKPEGPSRRILDGLGLTAYFDAIVGGDGPHGRKPDPAGLRALAHGDRDVMLVGDSPIDWATARAAGCAFAWARYGFSAARFADTLPETPYVLNQPTDLIDALARFTAIRIGA
jgi:phosphoglycolate phosphatase